LSEYYLILFKTPMRVNKSLRILAGFLCWVVSKALQVSKLIKKLLTQDAITQNHHLYLALD